MNTYGSIYDFLRLEPKPDGLCQILFTPFENVESWPDVNPATSSVDSLFSFSPGTEMYYLKGSRNNRVFSEELKKSDPEEFFDISVEAKLAGINMDAILTLQEMRSHQFVVFVQDKAGFWRVIGNKDAGADFEYSYTSGALNMKRNAVLTFKMEQSFSPFVVSQSPSIGRRSAFVIVNNKKLIVNDKFYKIYINGNK